jgi:hypothetical protein
LGRTNTRNGVGVILDEEMKSKIVNIGIKSDRISRVKLVFEEKVISKRNKCVCATNRM